MTSIELPQNLAVDASLRPHCEGWTLTQGLFAIMGGLGIRVTEDFHPDQKQTSDGDREILFMDRFAVEALVNTDPSAALGLMPSEEEIASKSKADGTTKAIVCTQALWFIAQCLTRGDYSLP